MLVKKKKGSRLLELQDWMSQQAHMGSSPGNTKGGSSMKTGVTVLVSKTNSPSSHCIQLLAAASESFASFDTGILAVLSTTVSECFTDIEGIVKNASTQTLPSSRFYNLYFCTAAGQGGTSYLILGLRVGRKDAVFTLPAVGCTRQTLAVRGAGLKKLYDPDLQQVCGQVSSCQCARHPAVGHFTEHTGVSLQ